MTNSIPYKARRAGSVTMTLKYDACWDEASQRYLLAAGTENVTIIFGASSKPVDPRFPDGPRQNVYVWNGVRYNE